MKPLSEWMTPELSRQLQEEALRLRDLGDRTRLGFREAQQDAFEGYAEWEEHIETVSLAPDTALQIDDIGAAAEPATETRHSETRQTSRSAGLPTSRGSGVERAPSRRTSLGRRFREHPVQSVAIVLLLVVVPAASGWAVLTPLLEWLGRRVGIIQPVGVMHDVMLVLDQSGSIDAGELTSLKTAAKSFVTSLALTTPGNHAGEVKFENIATLDQSLTGDPAVVTAAIDAVTRTGGLSNLEEGILKASSELASTNDRPDGTYPDVMIIITDGQPTQCVSAGCDPDVAGTAAATAAKAAGTEIFVIGVGVNPTTATFLRDNIATDASHYFDVADYTNLDTVLRKVRR